MSAQPQHDRSSASTSKGGGSGRVTHFVLIGLALAAFVAATTSAVTVGVLSREKTLGHQASPVAVVCSTGPALTIAAAPDIAPVIADVVKAGATKRAPAPGCQAPQVTSQRPVDVLDAIRSERTDPPDVWIPDSSVWTGQPMPAGLGLPQGSPSVARSPMVLAVPAADAPRSVRAIRTVSALLPVRGDLAVPVRWGLPDPKLSPASIGAVLALQQATAGRPDGPSILGNVLRASSSDLPAASAQAQLDAGVAAHLAVPVSEQAVWAYNEKHAGAAGVVPTLLGNPGYSFDYPFVVLATQHNRRAQAADLLADLNGALGQRLLAAAGFRDSHGLADGALTAQVLGASLRQDRGAVPDSAALKAASSALSAVLRGSRLLAVIDVSGSMATPVPGRPGATRLDLALRASVEGLALYPDNTQVGLWTFSTHLTRTTDYAVQSPILPLGSGPDGVSGRMRLAQALAAVTVKPNGDTALYDTALAAVREVRRNWDPTRENSVVLITDGANDDPQGLTLSQLLATLRAENDPARPVALYAIAYGPTSDAAALTAITDATGGRTYVARDPNTIGKVLMDAIGRRACARAC